jgi:hypothetical protein
MAAEVEQFIRHYWALNSLYDYMANHPDSHEALAALDASIILVRERVEASVGNIHDYIRRQDDHPATAA